MINELMLSKSSLAVRLYVKLLRGVFILLGLFAPSAAARLALKVFLTPPRTRASRWERNFESVGAEEFILVGDKRIRLLRHGHGVKSALLVHGWGSRGTHLGSYAEALAQVGYTVVTMDGPGHGSSSGSSTDMMEYAQAIAAAADHIGHVDVVVGHSFGAACTLLSLNLFSLSTDRLVLISCFADAIFITDLFARFFRIKPPVIRGMRELLERRYGNTWKWEGIAPTILIQAFNSPILLIHDLYDNEVPFTHAEELQKSSDQSLLFRTEGHGHRKILRDKRAVQATITFSTKGAAAV